MYTCSFNIFYDTVDLKRQSTTQPPVSPPAQPPTSQKLKVLISYGREEVIDKFAETLHGDLTTNGYECTLDAKDVCTGVSVSDVVSDKIADCDAFIVVFSQKSSQSEWCRAELAYAKTRKKKLIVIKRQELGFLSRLQFLFEDWFYLWSLQLSFIKDEEYDESFRELIRALEEV